MKKVILSGVAMLALASATLFTTTSCKKDEVLPGSTVAGAAFDTEVSSKLIYANNSQDAAAANTGSLYSFSAATSGTKCTLVTTAGFQLQEASGAYTLTNINKGSTAAGCIADGAAMPKAATFATTTLTYLSATAGDVSSVTGFVTSVTVTNGTTVVYKTSDGKNGIMSIALADDAGAVIKKKMTFSYKTIK